MTIEQVRAHIGKRVMSRDVGRWLCRLPTKPHGPYVLKQVTKAGFCIMEGREDERIPPRLLTPYDGD